MGEIDRQPAVDVEVDFGAGPRRLSRSTRVLDLTPGHDGLVPMDGPIDWSPLDALPHLLTVEWSGPERGIIAAISARPGIRFLYWDDADGDLDLRATSLSEVRLTGAAVRQVRLPESIETLMLRRPSVALSVDAPQLGQRLDLRLFTYGSDIVIPVGLRRTPTLWLWVGGEVSASVLASLTHLKELTLTFDSPPGVLTDLAELGKHQRLRRLSLDDAYGLDPDGLPVLASLQHLHLNGTRRTTGAAAKARWKGSSVSVSVEGAKSEAWLAAHLDNPFRDWVDESKTFGRAACAAYTRAWRAIDIIDPGSPDRLAAAEQALRGFVAEFNVIDDKHRGFIDTLYREEIWDVFCALANRLRVPEPLLDTWFDDERRF